MKSKNYNGKREREMQHMIFYQKNYKKRMQRSLETVLSAKINNLRRCFRKEMKKIEASMKPGASTDEAYTLFLWYYDLMLFLKDQETDISTIFNIHQVSNVFFFLGG